jgi:translation initiation factor IF-3
LKGIRLRPNIDVHDLNIKLGRAREFLTEGHKVQFTMIFRGRQMAHRNIAFQQMQDICKVMEAISKVETMPRMLGRRMTMVLTPDTTDKKTAPKPQAAPSPAATVASSAPAPAPAAADPPPSS